MVRFSFLVLFSSLLSARIHVEGSKASIVHPVRGESRGNVRMDSPVGGECILISRNHTPPPGEDLYR